MARCVLWVALAAVAASACGRARGVSDEELGALVVSPKPTDAPIDVARAAKDPAELGRALARPYRATIAALGPHAVTVTTTTQVEMNGAVVDDRADKSVLELGDGDAFHGTYESASDYGRETIFVDKTLYLKPRYQRWHQRAPEAPDEPLALRDAFADAAAATWELVAPGVELTDKGATTIEGRAGRAIEIKLAPRPAANPSEPLAQRKWREGRTIQAVSGQIVLDADKGVPLAVELTATIGFAREGHPLVMKLGVKQAIASVGKAATIAAPAKPDVVATPERLREVDDRDFLLDGIAPSTRQQQGSDAKSGALGTTP